MKTAPFLLKIMQERGGGIRFIQALENDKPCWFYLKVAQEKITSYQHALKNGDFDIADYGDILESDWGDYPPADVIHFMKIQYNFVTPPRS